MSSKIYGEENSILILVVELLKTVEPTQIRIWHLHMSATSVRKVCLFVEEYQHGDGGRLGAMHCIVDIVSGL
jgi:hypothetical protein